MKLDENSWRALEGKDGMPTEAFIAFIFLICIFVVGVILGGQ